MAKNLNKKQQLFVAEYLIDKNATRAYIAAGYSKNGAAQSAERLLRNADIQAEIDRKFSKQLEKAGLTSERVLSAIAKVAFFDPRKFFNADGSAKQMSEIDEDTALALAGMEVVELFEGNGDQKHCYGLLKKFKLSDRLRALELAGRHLKLFTDKVDLSGQVAVKRVVSDL